MKPILKTVFSQPSTPSGKTSKKDLQKSLIRLGVALALATAAWMSGDLAHVLNDGSREMAYWAALVYSLADLIQNVIRQGIDEESKP